MNGRTVCVPEPQYSIQKKACRRHAFWEWNNLVEHQKSCVYLQICKNGRDKFPNFYLTSIKKNGNISKVIFYISIIFMPLWRNWQTHATQNRTGNHMGSSPISGICQKYCKFLYIKINKKPVVTGFLFILIYFLQEVLKYV